MKTCGKCGSKKGSNCFSKSPTTPDGLDHWCKDCRHDYYISRRKLKLEQMYRDENSMECRRCRQIKPRNEVKTYCKSCWSALGNQRNLSRLGITIEEYVKIEREQNGVCAICKKPEEQRKRLSVDHDHSCCPGIEACGKCVRGLLCSRCNKMLGMARDDVSILQMAIDYLT